ncbi:bifunctional heptose 7-phosphate kinase/heptose 1-phosphate adenyltransferase [Daejeonella oryzae]|uniref:bifunctional heptose 7-phosphate kinase/heptose 1-phosphate adenyltransferase n=1 Tax=Daejeonella oryzae TaxID=1122943 RepID=UPI00040C717F|nr:bifunctional ADP-heptose synthase [Daejeonella oryzae]
MNNLFNKFNALTVLIIGDVMMDTYLWGKVERISPEAPVPIVSVHKKENRLGGAANVALNIQALGAKPIICSVIGDDTEGTEFLNLLKKQTLSQEGIIIESNRPTTVKTRIIGHNQQIVRVDSETDKQIINESFNSLMETIRKIISEQHIDAIIFEDYDKGVISEELIWEIVTLANQKNIITVVDPKKRNFLYYQNVTLFKPNLKELKDGLKQDIDPRNPHEIESAVAILQAKLNAKVLMVTLSELGVFISSENEQKLIPAHIRDIADVSGAGDTVIATTALCLAAGLDVFKTAALANLAGGLVCEQVGVVPISFELLLKEAESSII